MGSEPHNGQPAVFLDRDGVLVEDAQNRVSPVGMGLLDGVPDALTRLRAAGFALVVVTNQPVVARGWATLDDVAAVNQTIDDLLQQDGAEPLDAYYACPHHPNANLPEWRAECDCRKPRPGLLLQAARERGLDLAASYMVGDRPTDIAAGVAAGCRTIMVETGHHTDAPIVTIEPLDPDLQADYTCSGLAAAADWILAPKDRRSQGD
jgi:D-glycero-D-manno-heptose 1,7-bisphosphate phosphatase